MKILTKEYWDGIVNYECGNAQLGLSLVIRNLFDKKFPTRRYIRLIFKLCGTRTQFEFRFENSI